MKKLYIALSFVIVSGSVSAQSTLTQKADKLYNRYEYVSAAQEYLKLVEKGKGDGYIYNQLADLYFNMFNTVEAAKWYEKAVETNQDPEIYYRYAQMLKANGKYAESNVQMQKFASLVPADTRAISFNENPNYIPRLLDKQKMFDVSGMEVSSDKSEFGAVLYNNMFYFTSARGGSKDYGWNKEPYLDIYKADYNDDGTVTNALPIAQLNSKYHDGPISISADGNTAYFGGDSFRESEFEKDKAKKLKLGRNNIFKSVKEGDKWGKVVSLAFNSTEYSTSNPSLSRDGKTLYFSSDMPGGLGGVDIWKVAVNEDGTYGAPENLGAKVNTAGYESFPFIADDNTTLYFASSGHPGLGGTDVFQINLVSGDATNLGQPVNTEKDDFSFSFNKDKNLGFFSSNRNGNDDFFKAIPICAVPVTTTVTDAKTGAILANASVAIVDDKSNVIATEMSNDKGEVTYKVECNTSYTIQASKDGYESNTFGVAKSKG